MVNSTSDCRRCSIPASVSALVQIVADRIVADRSADRIVADRIVADRRACSTSQPTQRKKKGLAAHVASNPFVNQAAGQSRYLAPTSCCFFLASMISSWMFDGVCR
jgi:hypothetical protein